MLAPRLTLWQKVVVGKVADPPRQAAVNSKEYKVMSKSQRKAAEAEQSQVQAAEADAEQAATTEAAPADPFADVPVTNIGDDVSFRDFSETPTADPRKYATVHTAAIAERLPTVKNWKHERAMLVPGTNKREFKQGSVYGTIQQIVNAAGRTGIPAYVVASKLRELQVGNKRSHYCNSGDAGALPPVGWAEGWLNTAISKSIAGVHPTKQAPALREEVTEGEAKVKEAEAQGKLAANG